MHILTARKGRRKTAGSLSAVVGGMIGLMALSALAAGASMASDIFTPAFGDVPASHPYAQAIASLHAEGIVRGGSDGAFRPDATIARSEFVTIIARAVRHADEPATCIALMRQGGSVPRTLFADVLVDAWYEPAVCVAVAQQWVGGYSDHTFRPAEPVDVAAAAKILSKAFALPVADAGADLWYAPFLRVLGERGALPVSIVGPSALLTRGEMAEIIDRL